MMIPPRGRCAQFPLAVDGTSELTAPNYERVIEHTKTLQVFDESGAVSYTHLTLPTSDLV